jgi:hypothetical protein
MIKGTISRLELIKIKKKAMRHKAWFKTLNRIDRAIIDLTIHCTEKVQSPKLTNILTKIIDKLKQTLESPIRRIMKQIGLSLTKKISQIAQRWGNKSASQWVREPSFVQYLTIIYVNTPLLFKT